MKHLTFRLLVAILTFFVGVASTKLPSVSIHPPNTFKAAEQNPSVPEPEEKPQPVISARVQKISDLPAIAKYDCYLLQFLNEQEGWLGVDEKLWRTQDGGETWNVIFDGGFEQPYSGSSITEPNSIYHFQFVNSRVGWLLQYGEMFKTEDGGDSWQPFGQSLMEVFDGSPITFKFLPDGKYGWVAGGSYRRLKKGEAVANRYSSVGGEKGLFGVIFNTEDGGQTWRKQLLSGSGHIGEIYLEDTEHAWAVGTAGAYYLKNGRWLTTETDAWDKDGYVMVGSLDIQIGAPTIAPSTVYFANSKIGWLSNSNGYLGISTDGGRHWDDLANLQDYQEGQEHWPVLSLRNIYFSDIVNGWGLDSDGALRQTVDCGTTWTKIEMNVEFLEMFFLDSRHGWAVSKEGLFRINPPEQSSSIKIDYYAHLKDEHGEVLREWLKTKSYLRPAVEEVDNYIFQEQAKPNFEGNLKFLRDSLGENNYQYYVVADMNHDGKEDFAVLLVDTRKQKDEIDHFSLAIFNAPFKKGKAPAYYEDNLHGISNCYIVFDKISKKHLFLGLVESDVLCANYYPKGKTYYFKDCME